MIRFLFLTASSPFILGVYDDEHLMKKYERDGKASDVLPIIIDEAIGDFSPSEMYYTNGPGNHMSLKIAFVCLKALSIIKKIPLFGVSPFVFNGGLPIRAFANSYFVSNKGKIMVEVFDEQPPASFPVLPERADFTAIRGDEAPLFLLPAV